MLIRIDVHVVTNELFVVSALTVATGRRVMQLIDKAVIASDNGGSG